ncbi:MAG TPA: hypothetical protein VFO85_14170, partial [Vicinamibacteria bacterium]|nr:hypothetical protein [Vicinamibacteria bacterium]
MKDHAPLTDDDRVRVAAAEARLAEWLSIEPSPGFKAAVRRRVAAAPPRSWALVWPLRLAAGGAA